MPPKATLPADFIVARGQTQKDVNYTILASIANRFPKDASIQALDLPCGNLEFLTYVRKLYPAAKLWGADLTPPAVKDATISFVEMDLTRLSLHTRDCLLREKKTI